MKWKCDACGLENSDCKVYCKCGKINQKYAHLTNPPEQSKWRCLKNKISDNWDSIEDITKLLMKLSIVVGGALLGAHYLGWVITGMFLAALVTVYVFFMIGNGC